jgi:Penicillin binding protein transpeptidase domain
MKAKEPVKKPAGYRLRASGSGKISSEKLFPKPVVWSPKPIAFIVAVVAALMLAAPVHASPGEPTPHEPSYLLIDAATGRVVDARWDDPDRPLPMGSLIKPFTALAYAEGHRFTYPTSVCRGSADGCWLPAGHGRISMAAAVAGSCNAYFRQLSQGTSSDMLVSILRRFGMRASAADVTPASMVGLGESLKLAPSAIARGYLEIVTRATQPGIGPIVEGLMTSTRTGTGRAVGAAIGHADAFVKTGTAPCVHPQKASGDGYTVVVYPADRPRVVLVVQAHGRTGAETAGLAGALLRGAVEVR